MCKTLSFQENIEGNVKLNLAAQPRLQVAGHKRNMFSKLNMIKTKFWMSLMLVTVSTSLFAQVKYHIKGNIKGLKDTTIYLANYYGNKLYYNDTTKVDAKGNFTFEGKPFNEGGKYALVMPGPKYFDIVVADENIVIEADTTNRIENIKIKESENNKIFFNYINYINNKRKQREPIDAILADSTKTEAEKTIAHEQLKKLNDEVVAYQKNLISTKPDMLVTKLIKASMEIEIPEAPAELSDDEKKKWSYYYFRNHYWDNYDLQDPRLVRDQSFHKLIERFITQTLPQIPDTMTTEASKLIARAKGNEDAYKYIIHQFTYNFETSKIMCMDEGFVYMVDNYYSKGLTPWMKDDKIKDMKESADGKRHCLCGETALDIILPDMNDKWQSMKSLNTKYTLLVIWEASCGHCKKEMPKIKELYDKWKSKGLGVYAVHNNQEVDKWKKFVQENNLDFINVSRTAGIMTQDSATKLVHSGITNIQSLNYHQYWDVSSTPKVYLMDKDRKIIAKSLGAEQLDELLTKLEAGADVSQPIREHEYEDEDHHPKQPQRGKASPPKQGTSGQTQKK